MRYLYLPLFTVPLLGFQSPTTYINPVVTPVAADPHVIRAPDGTFYLYATQDDWGDGRGVHFIPIFRSKDMVRWEYVTDAFRLPPAWKDGGGFLWAPDVSYRRGVYYLYYAYSQWGDPNPCIGLATAKEPTGPFEDLGRAVFCSADVGVPNSIDPFVFNDPQAHTLIWGSFHGIYAVRLSEDGTRPIGAKVLLADRRFEAPFVYQKGGYYYLFVSSGSCCEGEQSTYILWVGRARNLLGPYLDRQGRDLRYGGG